MKILIAPALIFVASLLGRRYGNSIGGWLIALPLTSAPVAYVLAHEQGLSFAQTAATGMLTGGLLTIFIWRDKTSTKYESTIGAKPND